MVEKGQLDRKYLSTYHSERWPVAQNVLKVDKVAAKAAAGHEAADYCDVVEKHRAFTAGFGISYETTDDNLLLWSSPSKEEYVLQPGMRAPNYKVYSYATGKKTRLFDVVVKRPDAPLWLTFTLLVLASDLRSTVEHVSNFLNESCKAATSLPPINVVVVTTSTADQISTYKELLDSDRVVIDKLNQAQCHRAYHRKTNSAIVPSDELQVVLVRPDGYIGTILRDESSALSNRICQYFSNIA
jgi:phenol 2-monooxygenase